MVGLEREETGERVINLVRGQLNWEDRGWEGLRKEDGHLVQDSTRGCVRARGCDTGWEVGELKKKPGMFNTSLTVSSPPGEQSNH